MFEYIESVKKKWTDWFIHRAHNTHFKAWLAFISFTESIILPFPTVAFMILILMAGAKRWVYYATLTTIFSVIGGVVGYFIGVFFFDTLGVRIVDFYNLTEAVERTRISFENNAFITNFIGAFTPLPYKIFTLSSGFFKINFVSFILASILGRSAQFFLVAYATKVWGAAVSKLAFRYFNIAVLIILLVFIISLFV